MSSNSNTTRQRRGQKDTDADTTTGNTGTSASTASSSTTTASNGKNSNATTRKRNAFKLSAADQLARAEETVKQNKVKCDILYGQWKQYLLILSYIIVLLAYHQAHTVHTPCIKDIKSYNAVNHSEIDGKQAAIIVLQESASEIVNIILAAVLAIFISFNRNPIGNLKSSAYTLSCLLVPLQIGVFFQVKDKPIGCLKDGMELAGSSSEEETTSNRMFPISVVFHLIVTGAYWFMERGTKRCNDNLVMIQSLKNDFKNAKEKQAMQKEKQQKLNK